MNDRSVTDFTRLDRPDISARLFHPRKDWDPQIGDEVLIPVADTVTVGGRFHGVDKTGYNLLLFHGNGEIVSDYDEVSALYNRMGINFLVVDYRGYGFSGGEPTVSTMIQDCHTIFRFTETWLETKGYHRGLVLMGRSLGSASVLELAAAHADRIDGLVIESGFAFAEPLLQLMGIDTGDLFDEKPDDFRHLEKIGSFFKPTLIIHAEKDHIIPFSDGQALFDACPSSDKKLLKIPEANHNDIFLRGMPQYLQAVKALLDITAEG